MRNVFPRVLLGIGTIMVAISIALPAPAAEIKITMTNDQATNGFALAPLWVGVQNGSFNVFSQGSTASSAIATLAQFGNTTPLTNLFAGNGPETTLTSGGSLVQFLPGQSNSTTLNVSNPMTDQYLSYAGMVVPSNDFFQGNANPLQIFDSNGNFLGPITIKVYGSDIWDSDTEQQSNSVALTFIQGQHPGTGMQISNGAVTPFLSESTSGAFLQSINGLTTNAGYQLDTSVFGSNILVDTITISSVPEPSSILLFGLGVAGMLVAGRTARSRKPKELK